jgi:hypothetical protein
LDTVESSSHPGKFYEIRKSHQDGKTYCTCPGWIFKARKGDGVCKHIAAYMKKGYKVVVYKLEEFLEVKRARPVLYDINGNIDRGIELKRNKL